MELEAGGTSTGPKGRFNDNVKAVEVLKEIEARGPAPTEAAYARSDLFERRRLMDDWAAYLG